MPPFAISSNPMTLWVDTKVPLAPTIHITAGQLPNIGKKYVSEIPLLQRNLTVHYSLMLFSLANHGPHPHLLQTTQQTATSSLVHPPPIRPASENLGLKTLGSPQVLVSLLLLQMPPLPLSSTIHRSMKNHKTKLILLTSENSTSHGQPIFLLPKVDVIKASVILQPLLQTTPPISRSVFLQQMHPLLPTCKKIRWQHCQKAGQYFHRL